MHARFVALIFLSIIMMVLNHQQMHLKTIRTSLAIFIAPAQYIVEWPVSIFQSISEHFTNNQTLLNENENLHTQLLLVNARLQKLILLEQENNQLRKFLHSSVQTTDKLLVAQLLSVDPDPFAQQVIINKGAKQKLYLGQPVLDDNGIFGQVIELGTFSSRVMLITDVRSAVPVQDGRSGVRGIVVGRGDFSHLSLVNMPTTSDIQVGDQLVTSGLGGVFPVGYPVGVVTQIRENSGNQFSLIAVEPSAQLNQGHLVLLIWPQHIKATPNTKSLVKQNDKMEGNENAN